MRLNSESKIVQFDDLDHLGKGIGGIVVATNGCFDLLHVGHVRYLEQASDLGDHLVVGINGDESVRALKGQGRPINSELARARVIAGLECVSHVVIFPQVRATEFLRRLHPQVWAKAADYSMETIDSGERQILEAMGCRIVFLPVLSGISTTRIVSKAIETGCCIIP